MTKLSRRPDKAVSQRKSPDNAHLERRYGDIGISAVAAASCLKKPDDREAEQRRRVLQILARFEEHA